MIRKILLVSGILSSLLYISMNVFIPLQWREYSSASQTVSELSAISAPTRPIWVPLAMIYILLFAAFGWGVQQTAAGNRPLRITSILIFVYVIVNFYWPPMHLRGNELTLTDSLHIAWAVTTILLMMLIMGFAAAGLGKFFRIYTIITFILFLLFGILISTEAPGILKNTPTPQIGIWERINIGVFMIWVIVFAISLLKPGKTPKKSTR